MIYLITGVPGSGKTLYAVSTLIQKLAAEKLAGSDSRRVLIDGIPDLVLPHELMVPAVEHQGAYICNGDGIANWWQWCKPGDLIVVDEIQRYWRPRGMGTKPPDMIKMLETHRHFGVDFILITQNPMLIDQNVRRLVGRHQHVRRMMGMKRAIIYDWDSCSVDVNRTAGATSTFWNYPKDAYELYKSSELHTKQRQKIPVWLVLPVLAIVGMLALIPTLYDKLGGAMRGKGVIAAAPTPSGAASAPVAGGSSSGGSGPGAGYDAASFVPRVASRPESAPAYDRLRVVSDMPVVVGGYCSDVECKCVNQQGTAAGISGPECREFVMHPPFQPYRKYLEPEREKKPVEASNTSAGPDPVRRV